MALASALLLGGCGSDDVEETRVPARSYVTDICDATTTWLDDVQALNEELQAQIKQLERTVEALAAARPARRRRR